jgi:hypothetical protein
MGVIAGMGRIDRNFPVRALLGGGAEVRSGGSDTRSAVGATMTKSPGERMCAKLGTDARNSGCAVIFA